VDLTICDTAAEVGRVVARRISEALVSNPRLVLGLPAGSTPLDTYAELARLHGEGQVSFASATAFLLDEFVGLDWSHPGSFRRFITEHLLGGIDLDPERMYSLNGSAADPILECERYEETIAGAGGIDFTLLGIGVNGHVGFNEPAEFLVSRTHRTRLAESTRQANAGPFGGDLRRVPPEALSMGMGTILRADRIALMATGARKADAVARMVRGPVTTQVPASFLQLHRRVEVCLDRAAAAAL